MNLNPYKEDKVGVRDLIYSKFFQMDYYYREKKNLIFLLYLLFIYLHAT